MAVDLSNYVEVSERITKAKALYPEGRFQSRILELPAAFAGSFIAVETLFYRTPDDTRPAVGLAWEPVPGKTPYTKDSELMNAETSAWGRALIAAFAADAKKGIASREEVQARQPQTEPRQRSGGRRGPSQDAPTDTESAPTPRPQDQAPSVTEPAKDGNGVGQQAAWKIQADLLAAVNGDKPRAAMIWRTTLETFGLSKGDEIPADMLGPIETAVKAVPV